MASENIRCFDPRLFVTSLTILFLFFTLLSRVDLGTPYFLLAERYPSLPLRTSSMALRGGLERSNGPGKNQKWPRVTVIYFIAVFIAKVTQVTFKLTVRTQTIKY